MSLVKLFRDDLDWPDWLGTRAPADLANLFDGGLRVEEFQEDGTLVVRAEAPGIDPDEDVEITVSDWALRIKAERRKETKVEEKGAYRSEFRYGSFTRSIPLPAGATEDDVQASYHDGILEVRIPVSAERAEARRIPVARG